MTRRSSDGQRGADQADRGGDLEAPAFLALADDARRPAFEDEARVARAALDLGRDPLDVAADPLVVDAQLVARRPGRGRLQLEQVDEVGSLERPAAGALGQHGLQRRPARRRSSRRASLTLGQVALDQGRQDVLGRELVRRGRVGLQRAAQLLDVAGHAQAPAGLRRQDRHAAVRLEGQVGRGRRPLDLGREARDVAGQLLVVDRDGRGRQGRAVAQRGRLGAQAGQQVAAAADRQRRVDGPGRPRSGRRARAGSRATPCRGGAAGSAWSGSARPGRPGRGPPRRGSARRRRSSTPGTRDLHAGVDAPAVESLEDGERAEQADDRAGDRGAEQQLRVGGDRSGHRRSVYRRAGQLDRRVTLESAKRARLLQLPAMASIDLSARMAEVLARYDALTEQMSQPDIVNDLGAAAGARPRAERARGAGRAWRASGSRSSRASARRAR